MEISEETKRISHIRNVITSSNYSIEDEEEFYLSSWFINRFLRARKNNLKKTEKLVRGYFEFREKMENLIDPRREYYYGT